jgi:hypothetical protein
MLLVCSFEEAKIVVFRSHEDAAILKMFMFMKRSSWVSRRNLYLIRSPTT